MVRKGAGSYLAKRQATVGSSSGFAEAELEKGIPGYTLDPDPPSLDSQLSSFLPSYTGYVHIKENS